MFLCTEPGVYFNAELIDEIRVENPGDGWEVVATKTDGTQVVLYTCGTFQHANDLIHDLLVDNELLA
jgi:hypothetical protein